MKFLMQIFQGEALEAWSRLSEEEQQGIAADYAALNRRPASRRASGSPSPTRRRRCASQDGATVTTDGPFAETKEALGGYFMFEGDDLDARRRCRGQGAGDPLRRRGRDAPARPVLVAREAAGGCAKPIKLAVVPARTIAA